VVGRWVARRGQGTAILVSTPNAAGPDEISLPALPIITLLNFNLSVRCTVTQIWRASGGCPAHVGLGACGWMCLQQTQVSGITNLTFHF
jgi:hypothetical protein